jgi:D-sedoheptulose 7-phosphate isomerase
MKHLQDSFNKSMNSVEYLRYYSKYLCESLLNLEYEKIVKIIKCFSDARKRGSNIYFIGNGGSAATASHFAQDLAGVSRKTGKQGFRSRSFTDNVSFITAMGNDYGYESIFTCQMSNIFEKRDVLVAISASGNSQNVVEAVKLAKKMGGISIGLIGFDGGKLLNLCDIVIHVVTNKGEYGHVEDIHLILGHMITSYFMCNDENPKSESFIDE